MLRRAKKECRNRFVQEADRNDIWKYTAPISEAKASDLAGEEGRRATNREERDCMLIRAAFLEAPDAGEQPPLPVGGSAYQRINEELVGQLLARTRNESAPGGDTMELVKVTWDWAPECITAMVRACIELGQHPGSWKTAKGVVIPKPGKPDYAGPSLLLLDSISKLVERTAAHLTADHRKTEQAL